MCHPSRCLEDNSAESYVNYGGPVQEVFRESNIGSWARDPKMLEMHCCEIHVRESCIQGEEPAQEGGICCRQQNQSNLSPLTPDNKLWNLMFVLMRFSLIFYQVFFHYVPIPPFLIGNLYFVSSCI